MVIQLELRGLDDGALYVGDPIRLLVGLTPSEGQESGLISVPDRHAWTSALRVRLHREDGRTIGEPAKAVNTTLPSEIEFTPSAPAVGVWRWPQTVTAALSPGTYRVSARLLNPQRTAENKAAAVVVAETRFRLLPAPTEMSAAQRGRWHHLLAMDAFLAGNRERAKRLNTSSLSLGYSGPEALRLKGALDAPPHQTHSGVASTASSPAQEQKSPLPPQSPLPESVNAEKAPPPQRLAAPTEAPKNTPQWASSAKASSQYDNQKWSALQATGTPDVGSYGDRPEAWAPRLADAGEEWLELHYDPAVTNPRELRIHQNFNPGSLSRIEATLADGTTRELWSGHDNTPYTPNEIGVFTLSLPQGLGPIAKVKLTFDTQRTKGWEEIDAVSLTP